MAANEIESKVKTILNDKKTIAIRNVSKIADGLLFDCIRDNDCKELVNAVQNSGTDLIASEPKVKKPKIVIRGVDNDITEEDITYDIIEKNVEVKNLIESEGIDIKIAANVLFKYNKSDSNTGNSWVVELHPKVYKCLKTTGHVFIGWRSHRFSEYLFINRCFNCHRFGHKSSECRDKSNKGPVCGVCAGNHDHSDCKQPEKCINCVRHNTSPGAKQQFPTNHSVFSQECKCFQRVKQFLIKSTNYE
jgi:hypothetical protein